jgi:hypothetical protein
VVLVGIGVVVGRNTGRGDDGGSAVREVALRNDGLSPEGRSTSGTATLVRRGGRYYLDLRLHDPPAPAGGYLEVWLIDRQVKGMVSLGPYRGPGAYALPANVDPSTFPVVDVSDEPLDGDPLHSGVSLVRGVLPAPR